MAIQREQIKKAIHAGIGLARRNYVKWSLGWTLEESGVEGVLVSEIARKLHADLAKAEFLLLEVPIAKVQEWSGAERPMGRKRETLRGTKRTDIVLFNGYGSPTCVIEVKRCVYGKRSIHGDLVRIRDVLLTCAKEKRGTLKRGFLAISYNSGQAGNVKKWIDEFFARNTEVRLHDLSDRAPSNGGRAACSMVIEVTVTPA